MVGGLARDTENRELVGEGAVGRGAPHRTRIERGELLPANLAQDDVAR